MRELRGQRDAPVAEGRHGSPSVQRVRLVQQDQRSESAAGQVCTEENQPGTIRHDKPIMTTTRLLYNNIFTIGQLKQYKLMIVNLLEVRII